MSHLEHIHQQLESANILLDSAKHTYQEADQHINETVEKGTIAHLALSELVPYAGNYRRLAEGALEYANEAMDKIQEAGLPPVIESSVWHIGPYMEAAAAPLLLARTNAREAHPFGDSIYSKLGLALECLAPLHAGNTAQDIAQNAHSATVNAKDILDEISGMSTLVADLPKTLNTLTAKGLVLTQQGLPNIVNLMHDNTDGDAVCIWLSDFRDRSIRSAHDTYKASREQHLAKFITHMTMACAEVGENDTAYIKELTDRLDAGLKIYKASRDEKTKIVELIDDALLAVDRLHYIL